jgi:hypothetical protein
MICCQAHTLSKAFQHHPSPPDRAPAPRSSPQHRLWLLARFPQVSHAYPEPLPASLPPRGYQWPTGSSTGLLQGRDLWLDLLTGVFLLDVDECVATDLCLGGHCVNTEGSFNCLCETGFQPSPESGECVGKGSGVGGQGTAPHPCLSGLSSLE